MRFSVDHIAPFAGRRLSAKLAGDSAPPSVDRKTGLGRFRDHGGAMTAPTQEIASLPDMKVSIRQLFGFDSDMEVPAYSEADEHGPDIDPDYPFVNPTTPHFR